MTRAPPWRPSLTKQSATPLHLASLRQHLLWGAVLAGTAVRGGAFGPAGDMASAGVPVGPFPAGPTAPTVSPCSGSGPAVEPAPPPKRRRLPEVSRPSPAAQALRATSERLSALGVQWEPQGVGRLLSKLAGHGQHPGAAVPRRLPAEAWSPSFHPALRAILLTWGAELYECGATGRDISGRPLSNQCFYLCLAAATSVDPGALATTAYEYKQRIEAAVLLSRGAHFPLEAEDGAFADFLEDGMSSVAALHHRAVAVADATSGGVIVYSSPAVLDTLAPVILLWHTPGHYQLIQWNPPAGQPRPRPGPFGERLDHPPGHEDAPVAHTLIVVRPPVFIDLN